MSQLRPRLRSWLKEGFLGLLDRHNVVTVQVMGFELSKNFGLSHIFEQGNSSRSIDPICHLDLCRVLVHMSSVELTPEQLKRRRCRLGFLVVRLNDLLLPLDSVSAAEKVRVVNPKSADLVIVEEAVTVQVNLDEKSFQSGLGIDSQVSLNVLIARVNRARVLGVRTVGTAIHRGLVLNELLHLCKRQPLVGYRVFSEDIKDFEGFVNGHVGDKLVIGPFFVIIVVILMENVLLEVQLITGVSS